MYSLMSHRALDNVDDLLYQHENIILQFAYVKLWKSFYPFRLKELYVHIHLSSQLVDFMHFA